MSNSVSRIVKNATCTFCGCLCDDIHLTIENVENVEGVAGDEKRERITHAENACALGKTWFDAFSIPVNPTTSAASIKGHEVSLAEAVDAAAQLLAGARSPLIYGLRDTTCETQQQAVALADLLGAGIDTAGAKGMARNAFLDAGESGATLGEVRNRADLIVYWGSNPEVSQPRHMSRHVMPPGLLVPNGRRDRTVVVIDVRRTATADAADIFVQVKPDSDFELIWVLRALLKGKAISADIEAATGVPLAMLQDLAARMKGCRYGVLFYGPGLTQNGQHFNASALQALTVELNDHAHFVARPMRSGGNPNGAENVLTWQTSYPFAVDFSRGFPRFNPGEFGAADVLARGEVDAVLIVAADPETHLPQAALAHLAQIPHIVLSANPTAFSSTADVSFVTATYGIHTAGTVYRNDGVTLRLRPALSSPYPSDESILLAVQERLLVMNQRKVVD